MAQGDASGWWLTDGEERSRIDPRSFFIPSEENRRALRPGRLAKLGFLCEPRLRNGTEHAGERMWVEVVHVAGDGSYTGTLQNDPTIIHELQSGDEVRFEPRHVIAIEFTIAELGYDPSEDAAVDPQILQRDTPPTRVVRFQPPGAPGPLWFVALDGDVPPEAVLVPLGSLTDFWPELGGVFQAGTGDWLRHPDRPEYISDTPEHQQDVAAAALGHAATLVLDHPVDPKAAEAEAHFENVLEAVVALHWTGEGRPDGVAHPGFQRLAGRLRLRGRVRVRDGADRPFAVDISLEDGGSVTVGPPDAKKPRRLGRAKPVQEQPSTRIDVPSPTSPGLG